MTDFEWWLVQMHELLSSYTVDEIKERALLAGFPLIEVSQWVTKERFRRAA